MVGWLVALGISLAVTLALIPKWRGVAFKSGWFERRRDTSRPRGERLPTHAGLVLALAVAAGSAVAVVDAAAARAAIAACVIGVATGYRVDGGKGSPGALLAGRVAVAAAVAVLGARVDVTGSVVADGVLTGLLAFTVIGGLAHVSGTAGTATATVAMTAVATLVIAARIEHPAAAVAAALLGASSGATAHAWPPALVRIGRIGPTVLGAALTAAVVDATFPATSLGAAVAPTLLLSPFIAAAFVRALDAGLRDRGVPPHVALPLLALLGGVAADLAIREQVPAWMALIALVPAVVLAILGRRPLEPDDGHRSHLMLAGVVVGLGALAVAGAASIVLLGARRDMESGRSAATAGLELARDGELERAQQRFEVADAAFARAERALTNPFVRVGELVPVVGPNLRSARTLADVGGDLSSTAVAVADRAGADELRVIDGVFPVVAASRVGDDLIQARATLDRAVDRLDSLDSPYLLPQVRDANDVVSGHVADAGASLEVAAEATRLAPRLLGLDGDRRWIVAILTPSESRGAGGLAGDYAELRAVMGDIDLVRTIPVGELNRDSDAEVQRRVLPAIYEERYGGFLPAFFWQNLPAPADVPTFGEAIGAAFPLVDGGGPVDGVVTVDPHGIAALLRLTGPVVVEDWPVPLTADNVARVLLFDHYVQLDGEEREEFQSTVVEAVVDALTTGELAAPSRIAATLTPAVAGGHLRLWSPDDEAQALFARIGADGAIRGNEDGGDYVSYALNNGSESKVDWYLRRSLTYTASVDPGTGDLRATARISLRNNAPARGVPDYILGGRRDSPTDAGENRSFVTLYTPHFPVAAKGPNGEDLAMSVGEENGLQAATVMVRLPPGSNFHVDFELEGNLGPTDRYRLVVDRQPSVQPDAVAVQLTPLGPWAVSGRGGDQVLERGSDTRVVFDRRLVRE